MISSGNGGARTRPGIVLDSELFRQGFSLLCERYGKRPSQALRGAYYDGLSDLRDDEFACGVRRALHDLEFWPTIGQLRPELDPAAPELAWDALQKRHGVTATFGDSAGFDSGTASKAAKATSPPGGWGMMPLAEEHWYRKRFLDAYAAYGESARIQRRDELPPFTAAGKALVRAAMAGELQATELKESA